MPATVGPMGQTNRDIVSRAYDGWASSKGDPKHFLDVVAPNIKLHSMPGNHAPLDFTKPASGLAQLQGYFAGIAAEWEMVHCTVDELIAQDDVVVMRGSCEWRNKRTGRSFETQKIDFWRMEDGRAVEFREYFDTAAAMAAAVP